MKPSSGSADLASHPLHHAAHTLFVGGLLQAAEGSRQGGIVQ